MKKLFILVFPFFVISIMFLSGPATAQAPEKISCQAVIRDNSNQLVTNKQIGMRVTIQKPVFGIPPSYQNVYMETHTPLTNNNGPV